MRTTLYRHWNANDDLLYVGISLSHTGRLAQHKRNSRWFYQISRVTLEHYDTREEALAAERHAIKTESPVFNVVHAPAANDNRPLGSNLPMKVYLVREMGAMRSYGIAWASSESELWDVVDEFDDPYGYEFAEAARPAGLFLADTVEASDDDVEAGQAGWNTFAESEMLSRDLFDLEALDWRPFCPADEGCGIVARLVAGRA